MPHPRSRLTRAGSSLALVAALLSMLGLVARPATVAAAPLTPGNLVIYRVGSGTGSLVNTGNPVFLDEYSPDGTLVQTINLPTTTSGSQRALVSSGTATSEGLLSRSADGNYLVLTGYASTAATSLSGTSAATVNRVVGRVSADGQIDTSTALADFADSNNPRGVASSDGNNLWVTGGAGGIRYTTLGSTSSTQLSTTVANLRQPQIFSGQLYVSTSSGSSVRVGTVGSGLPTTSGQTITNLPGFPASTGSPYSFFLADLSAAVAGDDTLYVADDAALALTKYSLVGGSWTASGTVGVDTDDYRGLTGVVSGTSVTLYATRKGGSGAAGGGELVRLTDASGYNGTLSGTPTVLATAAANTAFRGVALAPGVAPTQADLTVDVAGPGTATINTAYSYTLTVSNLGTASASAISVRFTLPGGVTYNSASGTDGFTGAESGGVVTFSGGSLAAGGSATLTVSVTPTALGTVTVPAGAAVADPANTVDESNETNNSSTTVVPTSVGAAPNTPPTIQAQPATARLQTPTFSGVIGDPTDPAATVGITLTVGDAETPAADLGVTASSSNPAVVPSTPAGLVIEGSGAARRLKVVPTGVGYADITVTVTDAGNQTDTVTLSYAASAAPATPSTTRFHTGISDASTALQTDDGYMLVANDENQPLRLYNRDVSGLPLNAFDFTANLNLTDTSGGVPREVDIESAARSGDRIFWLGSHSNSSGGSLRPNRYRLFATDISGSGSAVTLSFVGYYAGLRSDLIAWDQSNGHGKGADYYGFAASAAAGVIPEEPSGAGFNIEGAAFAPDGSTLYLGFRAPIVPATARTRALIVPVVNAQALVGGSPASGPAQFGAPIEFDLGGRGIRELRANASGEYLIVAGPPDAATGTAPKDFRLYSWSGEPDDAPVLRGANLTALNTGGSIEGIVEVPDPLTPSSLLRVISDNGDTVWYGDGTISKELQAPFQKFRSDRVTLGGTPARIRDIQGLGHISPFVSTVNDNTVSYGTPVIDVPGIVTAVSSNGFYIQDPSPDSDPATSEGLFVFTGSGGSKPSVGDAVLVSGAVAEARAGCTSASCTPTSSGWNNLTTTELTANSGAGVVLSWTRVSASNPLPAATVIGAGGRVPPTSVIEDDTDGSVETDPNTFDPASDGLDFYESLEGMRVQLNDAAVVGATTSNGEIAVLADSGAGAGPRTPRGGIIIGEDYSDFNPERVIIDDALTASPPQARVGSMIASVLGVMDYSFGNYKLLNTQQLVLSSNDLQPEVTALEAGADQITVADFNVENLISSTARLTDIATIVVDHLGAPDILAVQEIQDNNGTTNNGVVAADQTFAALVSAISNAGGPTYQYRQIDPANNQDGGAPGGNIRVGFLFRSDRGLAFVDRPGGTLTDTAVLNVGGRPQLSASPGRIDPSNPAFTDSRKPLVGEFTYNGRTLFVINNHLNSKGGDQSLFGRFQPPERISEAQRTQQAQVLHDFVADILAIDAQAAVVLLGDLNDFHFAPVLDTLKQGVLNDLIETLPANQRYTYVFDGNSQSLDHILVSDSLLGMAEYDIVHVNAEFPDAQRVSDHDPSVMRLTFDATPPDTRITSQPSNPSATANATFTFTGTDNLTPTAGLTFECSLDGAAFTACTSPTTYNGLSNGSHTFRVRARDAAGNLDASPASYIWTVRTPANDTTPPETSIIAKPASPSATASATFTFTGTDNVTPPGGLTFECSLDGAAFTACTRPTTYSGLSNGSHTFRVRARDAAGNLDASPASYTWIVRTSSRIYLPLLWK